MSYGVSYEVYAINGDLVHTVYAGSSANAMPDWNGYCTTIEVLGRLADMEAQSLASRSQVRIVTGRLHMVL